MLGTAWGLPRTGAGEHMGEGAERRRVTLHGKGHLHNPAPLPTPDNTVPHCRNATSLQKSPSSPVISTTQAPELRKERLESQLQTRHSCMCCFATLSESFPPNCKEKSGIREMLLDINQSINHCYFLNCPALN